MDQITIFSRDVDKLLEKYKAEYAVEPLTIDNLTEWSIASNTLSMRLNDDIATLVKSSFKGDTSTEKDVREIEKICRKAILAFSDFVRSQLGM